MLGILTSFFCETVIISEVYWKTIVEANRQLALRFEKLQKARTGGYKHGITMAEMDYFQALQCLYDVMESAVNAHHSTTFLTSVP